MEKLDSAENHEERNENSLLGHQSDGNPNLVTDKTNIISQNLLVLQQQFLCAVSSMRVLLTFACNT
jgi:hypothetical protein